MTKRKINRVRLRLSDPAPRHESKRKRKRERLYTFEPASAMFTELLHEIGSINPKHRHDAARRLAAHCAVVFRDT